MKVHIIFPFKDGPYGGGNQFLKALRVEFRKADQYAEIPEDADIFLFNSFQNIRKVLRMKYQFPKKPFVHRVDGPISLYRGNSSDTAVDRLIYLMNDAIADATIFQSRFSMDANKKLGISKMKYETIIHNAPTQAIFYPRERNQIHDGTKIKLISTSWSSNPMKGFDIYRYLDEHLDYSLYEYIFVGNSPVLFKNISMIPPQTSESVAHHLRSADIYITASRKDPCSNSLIEALSCGLPAIALNDGGHPELIQQGGELFDNAEEALRKIKAVSNNYLKYHEALPSFDIKEKAREYVDFLTRIQQICIPKTVGSYEYCTLTLQSLFRRI